MQTLRLLDNESVRPTMKAKVRRRDEELKKDALNRDNMQTAQGEQ